MPKRLRILIDLDEIVVDLKGTWLAQYNKDYDDNLTTADITTWEIDQLVKPECGDKILSYTHVDGFYYGLKPIDGAIEAVKYLATKHNVMILSAGSANPNSAAEKIRWVQEHLGFKRQRVMIGQLKEWVKGDVLIDDSPGQIKNYRKEWPNAHILTIEYPYNEVAKDCVNLRAASYKDQKAAWGHILTYIDNIAG
jgi:5'(3')-deoxyribonucleotidase